MEEKNELNDIILNKGGSAANNKKIILAVATLGVVLIIVVMLMNTLTSKGTDNLPQAILPPEPQAKEANTVADEPLFEPVEVVQDGAQNNDSLDMIAQKLKEESQKENVEEVDVQEPVESVKKPAARKEAAKAVTKQNKTTKPVSTGAYYIQVGSFAKYEPNKKFLDSILRLGYKYKFHQVTNAGRTLNKVLVGPFYTEAEARQALRSVRSSIEAGAFLTKI